MTPTVRDPGGRGLPRRHRHLDADAHRRAGATAPKPRRRASRRRPACRTVSVRSRRPIPVLDLVAFYSRNLAVPGAPRRRRSARCSPARRCSTSPAAPPATGRSSSPSRDAPQPEQRFQLIWPYTDLLLHDMGEGLADGRPVGDASGTEWRTAPLWGIGLTETVSGHTFFLHDGRARNLTRGDPLARRRGGGGDASGWSPLRRRNARR